MKHIDLFSGIGGFAHALDQVFYDRTIEHIFCDNNPFSQAVLKKHWPKAKIYGDIRAFTNSENDQRQLAMERKPDQKTAQPRNDCFIVTGGFPCQPFSAAGRRKGTEDDRYLWPEMFRVIREFSPRWVVAENVRGLTTWNDGMVLEQVCSDLENAGYEVQPFIIPAVAVGAPHRRDRIWIVANRQGERSRGSSGQECRIEERELVETKQKRCTVRSEDQGRARKPDASNAQGSRSGRLRTWGKSDRQTPRRRRHHDCGWESNWFEVASRLCRLVDGLPARMGDAAISKAKHRNEQLKAYGNAIVPQVAMQIFKAIKLVESI